MTYLEIVQVEDLREERTRCNARLAHTFRVGDHLLVLVYRSGVDRPETVIRE